MNGVLGVNLATVSDANFEAFFHIAKDAFWFAEANMVVEVYSFFCGLTLLLLSMQMESAQLPAQWPVLSSLWFLLLFMLPWACMLVYMLVYMLAYMQADMLAYMLA